MSAWADLQARGEVVNWPIDQIFDKALQWKATLYYNMGWELPEVYVGAYKDFQRAMMEYIDAPLPGPGPVPSDTTFVLLGGAVIDSVLVWPGDVTWQHPCVGGVNRCKLPSGGRLWIAPTRGDFEGWGGADADLVEQRGSTWTFNTSGRTNIFIEAVYPDAPVPEPVTGEVIALLEAIQLQLMTLEEAVQQIREAQRRAAQAILEEE
jgi:hypothetical protein